MKKLFVPDFFKELVSQNEALTLEAGNLKNLPKDQLIKNPDPGKWSVLECFEHMNILYSIYLNNLNEGLKKTKGRFNPSEYYTPTLLGHYFYLSMVPNKKQKPRFKIKTFKRFEPTGHEKDPIDHFLTHHEEFTSILNKIPELNLDKVKINSSLGGIMRFKLGDLFRIVTGHNQRHFVQIQKTLNTLSA